MGDMESKKAGIPVVRYGKDAELDIIDDGSFS
jgi:hypothetical protein